MKKSLFIIATIALSNSVNAQYHGTHNQSTNHYNGYGSHGNNHQIYQGNSHGNQHHAYYVCNVNHGQNNGYNPYGGYYNVMSNQDLINIRYAIKSESFSRDKMNIARQAISGRKIKSNQVVEIGRLFDFESDRLEFAKMAYANTIDKNNYYTVNSIFRFSSSKTQLSRFIYR